MKRYAFSMLELVFVIVIMGIIGKFGVEFLAKAYQSFIFTKINHSLQANTASSVEFIATRLQYRIKDSIIARKATGVATDFDALASVDSNVTVAQEYTILEWVSTDIDGFRGDNKPYWSGVADIDAVPLGTTNLIISPDTNTTAMNTLIGILSDTNSTINDGAIYFIGSNNDVVSGYGWDGSTVAIDAQSGAMHPINTTANINEFQLDTGNFSEVYEYYSFAWTANAIVLSADGNLTLHTGYQPWEGESYTGADKQDLLMQDVDTFQFMAIGSIVKIQICVFTDLTKGEDRYSICKEKTIY